MDEAIIRGRIDDLVKALNAKDIDSVISFLHPTSFHLDIVPH